MKMPTKHTNSKRTLVAAGAFAAVVGLATPTVALAHKNTGDSNRGNWNSYSHKWNGHGWFNHMHGMYGSPWWYWGSADSFEERSNAILSQIDAYIEENNLVVENGDTLRTAVVEAAAAAQTEINDLKELKSELKDTDPADVTAEQRAALKDQIKATFGAIIDYRFALDEYKIAVKAAATDSNVEAELKIDRDQS